MNYENISVLRFCPPASHFNAAQAQSLQSPTSTKALPILLIYVNHRFIYGKRGKVFDPTSHSSHTILPIQLWDKTNKIILPVRQTRIVETKRIRQNPTVRMRSQTVSKVARTSNIIPANRACPTAAVRNPEVARNPEVPGKTATHPPIDKITFW